jgi:hypothetical protein
MAERPQDEMEQRALNHAYEYKVKRDRAEGYAPRSIAFWAEMAAAFARQECATERERVLEEACKAVCKGCANGYKFEAGYHLRKNQGIWVDTPCKAAAIRKLSTPQPVQREEK